MKHRKLLTLALTVSTSLTLACRNEAKPAPQGAQQAQVPTPGTGEHPLEAEAWLKLSIEAMSAGASDIPMCMPQEALMAIPAKERAFVCLRKTCESTDGARFDEEKKECGCEDGKTFKIGTDGGTCKSLVAEKNDQRGLRIHSKDSSISTFVEVLRTGDVKDRINSDDLLEALTLDSIGNSTSVVASIPDRAVFYVGNSDAAFNKFDLFNAHFLAEEFEFGKPEAFDGAMRRFAFPPVGFEPDPSFLSAALGNVRGHERLSPSERSEFDSVAKLAPNGQKLAPKQDQVRQGYDLYRAHGGLRNETDDQSSVSLAGCAESCQVGYDLTRNATHLPQRVLLKKSYHQGTVIQRKLVVVDRKSNETSGVILLNAGGTASIIGIQEVSKSSNEVNFRLFDRKWHNLNDEDRSTSTFSRELHNQEALAARGKTSDFSDIRTSDGTAMKRAIVFCESEPTEIALSKWEKGSAYLSNFLHGPWDRTANGQPAFSNHHILEGTDTQWFWPNKHRHGSDTSSAAISLMGSQRENHIIPVPRKDCLSSQGSRRWKLLTQGASARVILIPQATQLSAATQAETDPDFLATFNSKRNPTFLWVMAAGDEGKRNPRLAFPANALTGNQLTLVVSALETEPKFQERIGKSSNFGIHHSDLAEYPYHPFSTASWVATGTALASARVAATAAELREEFALLRAPLIRLAMILGAHIPRNSKGQYAPLEVRSGGINDPASARRIAHAIFELGAEMQDQLLKGDRNVAQAILAKAYCGDAPSCRFAEDKVAFLIQTGVLR